MRVNIRRLYLHVSKITILCMNKIKVADSNDIRADY